MSNYQDYGYQSSEPSHVVSYLYDAVKRNLTLAKCKTILDVGCGNGSMAGLLIKDGYDVYGIDASASGIAIAKQYFGVDRFFVVDLEDELLPVPLRNITFDAIISTEVIEHVYSPEKYIRFCKNILPANGLLVISTPYHGYWKNLAIALLNKFDHHVSPLWEGGHIKFFSRETLSKLFLHNGFTKIRFDGTGRFPYFWKSMIIAGVKKV